MSVLPHENRAAVPPRGLSLSGELVQNPDSHRRLTAVSFCGHRSINPLSAMTCSSAAAAPGGPSVPLLMLKVSPHRTPDHVSET